jgi:hypothetical protein
LALIEFARPLFSLERNILENTAANVKLDSDREELILGEQVVR